MSTLTTYATIDGEAVQIVTPEPLAGAAGQALNDNFKALSDGVLAVQSSLNTHVAGTGSSVHGAVSANTASQIVTRDASGNFAAGVVTAGGLTLSGSGAVNVAGGTIVDGASTVYGGGSLYAGKKSSAPSCPAAGQLNFNTTSNQFQGYNGSAWTALANPASTNGAASLGTTYTATTSWASTGLTVTLPNAGTYLVTMVVRTYYGAATDNMSLRLYNSTDSAVIANSTVYGPYSSATGSLQMTTTASALVTTTGASKTIQLQAIQNSGSGEVTQTDANGGTYLTYVQQLA